MCLSEMSAIFDAMLSTTKVEYSLVSDPNESITLIFISCALQNNLLAYCGKLLVELVIFSIIY